MDTNKNELFTDITDEEFFELIKKWTRPKDALEESANDRHDSFTKEALDNVLEKINAGDIEFHVE